MLSLALIMFHLDISSTSDSDHTRHKPVSEHASATRIGNQQNINSGCGIFNNINGTQHCNMTVALHGRGTPSFKSDLVPLIEPYQSSVDALLGIVHPLEPFPPNPSVSALREDVNRFVPIVVCVSKTMEIVPRKS